MSLFRRPRLDIPNLPAEVPDRRDGEPGPSDWDPASDRIGVSCSGGGVRSASFCLGALQALQDRQKLETAKYVTAASGGAYMASAWAIANGESAGAGAKRPIKRFAPRSLEERWVRLHSSHLLADTRVYAAGVIRLVAGIAFGWFLVWLMLFGMSRPAGWIMSAAHPELKARLPIAEVTGQPETAGVDVQPVPNTSRYRVVPEFSCASARLWSSTSGGDSTRTRAAVVVDDPGVVQVTDGRAEILAQPTVRVVDAAPGEPAGGACAAVAGSREYSPPPGFPVENGDGQPTLVIKDQPRLSLTSTAVASPDGSATAELRRLVEVSTPASIAQRSGMTGRPDIAISSWQWFVGLALLGIAAAAYLTAVLYGPLRPVAVRILDWITKVSAILGVTWLALFVALPWCVQEIPPFLANLLHPAAGGPSADGGSATDVIVAALGLTGLLAAAVRMVANQAFRAGRTHGGLLVRLAVGVLVPLAVLVVFVDQLEFATANGPRGRFLGWGVGMDLASWPMTADWIRLLLVGAGLGLLLVFVDAHSWSLFPFYKRRLNSAYSTRRFGPDNDRIEELPYDEGPTLIAALAGQKGTFADEAATSHDIVDRAAADRSGPQLVVCCAANVSRKNVAPPGRRAVSFTVSRDWIGSSELGWLRTVDYERALGTRRLSDVTLPSLMAISGAAVSPGMGKMSKGILNAAFALLNVRLGVWLPHPAWVAAGQQAREASGRQHWWNNPLTRPSWLWFLREIFGIYRPKARYLYVSDGGHWENLGLVELLRRGCTEIYCISAAGDGPEAFGTLGEALALAREVLGVEFDIDVSPLRATGAPPEQGRVFLPRAKTRRGKDVAPTAKPWAPEPFVVGEFWYPPGRDEGVHGRILVVEANLTADMPWDVQTYAEAHDKFPDDPTYDQLFDHRQFESYRALGYHQIATGLESAEWTGVPPPTAVGSSARGNGDQAAAMAGLND